MKVGVISDSHGNINLVRQIIERMGEVDLYIHLGDYVKDARDLFDKSGKKYFSVKGNCDIVGITEEDKEEIIAQFNGKRFFICHGHQYDIKYGYNQIYYRALEWKADVVLFGHTHMPSSIWYQGILFFNPGSTTFPRGGSKASYGMIEIKDGEIYPNIYEV